MYLVKSPSREKTEFFEFEADWICGSSAIRLTCDEMISGASDSLN